MLVGLGMWNQGKIGVVALPRKNKLFQREQRETGRGDSDSALQSSLGGMTTP